MIKPFTDKLKKDPRAGWNFLMRFGDTYSVRQWMLKLYDYNTTEWLETYTYGTSWYDQALSEMVLEDVNFSAQKWYCVEGGSQEIAKRMYEKIKEAHKGKEVVHFGKKVVRLYRDDYHTQDDPALATIGVHVQNEKSLREYDAVFNSAPLAAMQRMDLRDLNLNWGTKQAIRSLGYGASCKVGIRFKSLWWIRHKGINLGGVGKTDLPIRNCVYPSYNIEDAGNPENPNDPGKPGVLLCSYTWSQEAQRIGSLINRDSPKGEDELKELLIDNLAKLHSNTPKEYDELHRLIAREYQTHYAWDWHDSAFAYFGPGQFQAMYPWIVRNDGKHIIIGEAASAHHAWVSAVRGVYQFLFAHSKQSKTINRALEAYNKGEIAEPFGPLPVEFDRCKDVKPIGGPNRSDPRAEHLAPEGEWARQGVIFEKIRQLQNRDQLDLDHVTEAQVKPLLDVSVESKR